jgi:hypothetical protein
MMRSLSASAPPDTSVSSIHPWFADTAILEREIRFVLRGLPWASIARVGGAILRAATDPERDATNGAAYLIPDDGEVFRMGNDTKGGVDLLSPKSYDVLRERVGTQALCVYWQFSFPSLSMTLLPASASMPDLTLSTFLVQESCWPSHLSLRMSTVIKLTEHGAFTIMWVRGNMGV